MSLQSSSGAKLTGKEELIVDRTRQLIEAGERFEAAKLVAKRTGVSPEVARMQVDEIANESGSPEAAKRSEATFIGETLKEAQKKVESYESAGNVLIKSKILDEGKKRITASGSTIDEAFARAVEKIPNRKRIVERKVVSEPTFRTTTVKAGDRDSARNRVKQSLSQGEKITGVTEVATGKKRLLGLGRTLNEYSVVVRERKAIVEVVFSCPAKIHATFSVRASVVENSAITRHDGQSARRQAQRDKADKAERDRREEAARDRREEAARDRREEATYGAVCKAFQAGRCVVQGADTGPCDWNPSDWRNCNVVIENMKFGGW